MQFSHHSSNPLEVLTSDSLNAAYHRTLEKAERNGDAIGLSSDDPLGKWDGKTDYQTHITHISGLEIPPFKRKNETPKAGPSRRGASYRPTPRTHVDLDEDMSDDELALTPNTANKVSKRTNEPEPEPLGFPEEEDSLDYRAEGQLLSVDEEADELPAMQNDSEYIFQNEEDMDEPRDDLANFPAEDHDEDENMREYDDAASQRESLLSGLSDLTPLSSTQSSPFSSPQSSRPASPDEALTLSTRPPEEQDEIMHEIEELCKSVPALEMSYDLVDRLGTGTFSSVYKAIDLNYDEWDNQPWLGHHPSTSTAYYQSAGPSYKGRGGRAARLKRANNGTEGEERDIDEDRRASGKVFVAVKRIYTTSGPDRIRNEVSIMEETRGCRHTSQIITAFRHHDQVVIILPYQRNMDFREFYQSLHPEGIKCYFRCLFRALRDIHDRGIIHRDVKPANFLYDPFTGIGTLCDFGLASRMEPGQLVGQCLHSPWSQSDPHGRLRPLDEVETDEVKDAQRDARLKSLKPADKVGYPEHDRRPVSKANRAGTRGFRAPEVLLKCGAQTGAIDVWSAGVILLFFLTGKFPIFQSNDDVEGLMEIAVIIGKKKIERAATLHGRTIATNIPDIDQDGVTWQEFVERLNPDILTPKKYDMRYYPHNCKHRDGRGSTSQPAVPPASSAEAAPEDLNLNDAPPEETQHPHNPDRYANPRSAERHASDMDQIYSFLESVMHYESTKRFTPRRALYHPFLDEPALGGDDEYVPHLPGHGVCKALHYTDFSRDVACVVVRRKCECRSTRRKPSGEEYDVFDDDRSVDEDVDEDRWCGEIIEDTVDLVAGQGIAIGNSPCEYHTDQFPMSSFHT